MSAPELADYTAEAEIAEEVLKGLESSPRRLPSKLLYDKRGSELFEQICEAPEYYPTRTEMGILRSEIDAVTARVGRDVMFVEYGSGASTKTRILLDHLEELAAYVPIDISREMLASTADALHRDYPGLLILPVCADYTADYELPEPPSVGAQTVFFYPGSTIGNFEPAAAVAFLAGMREHIAGSNGGLLIGVDLRKDVARLEAAYDDKAGVTAAFNLNLLTRLNRELRADFDLDAFEHRARFNATESRIEMHLESRHEQSVRIADSVFDFASGETICTEYSYKYDLHDFAALSERAGFAVADVWTDADSLFSVQYLIAI